jgi:hypothetical protein
MLTGYEQVRSIAAKIAGDDRQQYVSNYCCRDRRAAAAPRLDRRNAAAAQLLKQNRLLVKDEVSKKAEFRLRVCVTEAVLPTWRGRGLWTIAALGFAQTIAWASSYYLPAILAAPIARDLSISPTFVYGALSAGLVIAGLLGPRVGHFIDTFGGRELLAVSNLVLAAGLVLLSFAPGSLVLIASWVILGLGMGMGLMKLPSQR